MPKVKRECEEVLRLLEGEEGNLDSSSPESMEVYRHPSKEEELPACHVRYGNDFINIIDQINSPHIREGNGLDSYKQWKEDWVNDTSPFDWDNFKGASLDRVPHLVLVSDNVKVGFMIFGSSDVVIGMLQVCQFDVYALLDPGATLFFVTSYVAMKFDVSPKILSEPFSVSTSVGDSVLAKQVKLSKTFHPLTNGQAKWTIQTLEDMLRACVIDFKVGFSLELISVHLVLLVSSLKKCIGDPTTVVPLESVGMKNNLSYEVVLVEILDRQVHMLRNKEVDSVKVLWRNQFVESATWKAEVDMMSKYSHLFFSGSVSTVRQEGNHREVLGNNQNNHAIVETQPTLTVDLQHFKTMLDQLWAEVTALSSPLPPPPSPLHPNTPNEIILALFCADDTTLTDRKHTKANATIGEGVEECTRKQEWHALGMAWR
ncbi:hypothetical protein MTR67_026888 [Solanum verrucosum]|uniref:Gag-pol polyprotein n=1 Tax=Solanum verrucosum TaxID=315347 RepID=A0AAF0TZX9_SOLVR|nr:hypothetical protein MTR67_026888 [Solanum verrucosum]